MSESTKDIAVVGCGYWGKNLIRNFHELGSLAAVCDPDQKTAKTFAAQYDVPALTWEDVLKNADIKGVVIAAPASLHYKLARAALEVGKHVFVEKPMALEIAHGKELCLLAKENGLILMVGHLLRYHTGYQKLKELCVEGALGSIRYIYSNRLNLGKIRREEDILWSFAPHDISMILDLMQEEPESVTAQGGFYLSDTVADVTTTHMNFSGGRKAHIFVSWLHPFKEQKLVVVGSKAMAVFNDGEPWDSKLVLFRHSVDIDENNIPIANKAEAEQIVLEQLEPLRTECMQFIQCMKTGFKPKTHGEEGLRVLKVLQKATEALEKL